MGAEVIVDWAVRHAGPRARRFREHHAGGMRAVPSSTADKSSCRGCRTVAESEEGSNGACPIGMSRPVKLKKGRVKMVNRNEQKAIDDLTALAPEFAKLTRDLLFGDIWERPELSQRDKSLITVTCLVALNRIEQVEFHLRKAFENGLTKEELVAAITHIAFYAGWPTAASGFNHLKNVIDQQ